MMNFKNIATATLLSLVALSNVNAAAKEKAGAKNKHDPWRNHFERNVFSVGFEGFQYVYREPDVMKYKGNLYGVSLGYSYFFTPTQSLKFDLRVSAGKAHYSSNGTGKTKNVPSFLNELIITYNQKFKMNPKLHLTPYVGIGQRYKSDDSHNRRTTTGHWGYFRESEYTYIPLGLSLDHDLSNDWSITLTGEYDYFLRGTQKSYTYVIDTHKQKKGIGAKAELLANTKIDDHLISFGPFFNYWKIKDSNENSVYNYYQGILYKTWEPRNNTKELGLKLKFTF